MLDVARIPEELKADPRWVLWRQETRNERLTKVPYNAKGGMADSMDPQTWSDFAACLRAYEASLKSPRPFNGLGFVLGGGWAGVEVDDCIDNQSGGILHPDAEAYVKRLNSYTEISPSGAGIHILVRHDGSLTGGKKASHPKPPITDIGAYCDGRYYTVTGAWIDGTPTTINEATDELRKVMLELGKRPDVEEWVRKGAPGDPPVRLSGEDLRAWKGETFVTKPSDGKIDRSKSLVRLALILRANRVPVSRMADVLRERDGALGWHKYDLRKDKGEDELNKIVDFVFREREYDEPSMAYGEGVYTYDFPNGIRIKLESIQPSPRDGGLQAEIMVTKDGVRIHWGRLVLASSSGRQEVIKNLPEEEKKTRIDFWKRALESVCLATTETVRSVGEVVKARPVAWSGSRYLVYPMIPDNSVTVMFGDGGIGKGWFALALAVGIAWRENDPPVEVDQLDFRKHGNVLYVDAEDNKNTFEDRLLAIWRGFGLPEVSDTGIIYYSLQQTFLQDLSKIRQIIREHNIVLVIVDSYAMAVGTEPESSEAASTTMKALRDLKVASLVIAHISKAAAENGGAYKPYGSVIIANSARSTWEMQHMSQEDATRHLIDLYNRKSNVGRKHSYMRYRFIFRGTEDTTEEVRIFRGDEMESRDDLDRVWSYLKTQPAAESDIIKHMDKPRTSVQRMLERLREQGRARCAGSEKGGRGVTKTWEALDPKI